MKYRKKPVEIEAVLWDGKQLKEVPEWILSALNKSDMDTPGSIMIIRDSIHISTLEGITIASAGDYIIQGVKRELYACKPDIFALTYEVVY